MVNDFLGQIAPPPGSINTPGSKIETPNVKKRHRRAKSGAKTLDGQDPGKTCVSVCNLRYLSCILYVLRLDVT